MVFKDKPKMETALCIVMLVVMALIGSGIAGVLFALAWRLSVAGI